MLRLNSRFLLASLLFAAQVRAERPASYSWNVFADGLYWVASEETTNIWTSVIGIPPSDQRYAIEQGLSFEPKFGVRAGVGYTRDWDTQLYWTWYKTHGCSAVPSAPSQAIETQFFVGFINGDIASDATINWSLTFNMLDFELGHDFVFGKHLHIRPFIGLKGGQINQCLTYEANNIVLFSPTSYTSREQLTQKFWGIGPTAGATSKWVFAASEIGDLSLLGDFSLATLWGHWSFTDNYSNSKGQVSALHMPSSTLGQLVLRGFLGFGWDGDCTDDLHVTTQVGYELQWWVNQLRIPTFQQLPLHGDLTLQGGVFRCRFDF